MRLNWIIWTMAVTSFVIGIGTVQSCGGESGPVAQPPGTSDSFAQQFLLLMSDAQRTSGAVGSEKCADCHGGRADESTYRQWIETAHAKVGVSCEGCHGPGAVHAGNPSKENILVMPKIASPFVCAQCHTQEYQDWTYAGHAEIIPDPVEEASHQPDRYGKQNRCIACHSGLTHVEQETGLDLGTADNAVIQELAENTLNMLQHTAMCVTCHNPHANTGNLTASGKEVQLWKATFNQDTTDIAPGAPAAKFTKYNHICAQCHNGRGANPSDTALTSGTARPNMHDSNQFNMLMGIGGVEGSGPVLRNTAHASVPGQCSHCHMPDSRHTFTVSYDKGCVPCHTASDAASRVTSIKSEIVTSLYALRQRLETWAKNKFGDADFWDYTSIIQSEGKTPPDQKQVPIEVKRARHNYYFVLRDRCFGPHNAPYAKHLITVANDNLDVLGVPPSSPSRARNDLDSTYQAMLAVLLSDLKRAAKAEYEMPE